MDAERLRDGPSRAETRYEDASDGTWAIDLDEDGAEVNRTFIPRRTIVRGMVSTGDVQPEEKRVELDD